MSDTGARARQKYTGEDYSQALDFLRNYQLDHGLIPSAADPRQVLLEAAVLSTLAAHLGGHDPSRSGPYGIGAVRPDPIGIGLYMRDAMDEVLVRAVLPRLENGRVMGVPGLRWQKPKRSRDPIRVGWAAGNSYVQLRVFEAPNWELAVDLLRSTLADEDCWWTHHVVRPAERQAYDETVRTLESAAAQWSTVLRRLGLFGRRRHLDLTAGLPADQELDGPRPDLLRPRVTLTTAAARQQRQATTLMCRSREGGAGSTTTSLNLAASMALAGQRVLIVDGARLAHTSTMRMRLASHQPDQAPWVVVEEVPGTGRLALGTVTSMRPDQLVEDLRAYLMAVRSDFDIILVDTDPEGADQVGVGSVVDGLILPLVLTRDMFGWTEEIDHRTPDQRFRDEVLRFLADAFESWYHDRADDEDDIRDNIELDGPPSAMADSPADGAVHSAPEQDPRHEIARLTAQANEFLDEMSAHIAEQCGPNWAGHRQRWIDQLPASFGYDVDPLELDDEPGFEYVRHRHTPEKAADAIQAAITMFCVDGPLLAVVAFDRHNIVRMNRELLAATRSVLRGRGVPMGDVVIPFSPRLARSAGALVLTDPQSAAAAVFRNLATDLMARLG